MLDKTQEQIMHPWNQGESCLVSVVCTTYNHELYIMDAIESFLMQETDFPFEIIIHDDASTDNTRNIIKDYHSRYPDIIKPIFQKVNQYSKGGFKPSVFAVGYSNGKYIALCEGDDYWIDKKKLQIQVDAMQDHPNIDLSFHSMYRLHDGKRAKNPSLNYKYNRVLSLVTALNSVYHFAHTATCMFRRDVFMNLPDWFFDVAPIGDTFLGIFGARNGGALYINRPMSIYRVMSVGSWSSRNISGSKFQFQQANKILESLSFLKSEMPEYACNFNNKEAVELYHIAFFYLLDKNDSMFNKYIKDSFARSPFVVANQGILYKFRFFPSLLRKLSKIKHSTQI